MPSEIKSILQDKKILILGFGKEGLSTYRLLRAWFPDLHLTISDQNEMLADDQIFKGKDDSLSLIAGKDYLEDCNDFDLIIKSPGIPYDRVAEKCDPEKITSQTDLFLKAFASKVTGVTGTKGKSTTSSLLYHIFDLAGRKAILAGNIGVPPLDLCEKIENDTEVIFEMSSHQLEHIGIAPHTAVILNLFPEHLDHYKDFTAYKMAKFNISLMQPARGMLVYNADDNIIEELVHEQAENKRMLSFSLEADKGASAYYDSGRIICQDKSGNKHYFPLNEIHDLPGMHNIRNMMAAVLVCVEKKLDDGSILKGLNTYKRLEHRLEYVGTYKGISFYDDSIATIPEACIEALNTLDRVDLLILGGYDRGLEYNALYEKLNSRKIPFLVFIGDAGRRMHDEYQQNYGLKCESIYVDRMEESFDYIRKNLRFGDVCLLSPAAASYGMFRDFEERGEVFKKMAAAL